MMEAASIAPHRGADNCGDVLAALDEVIFSIDLAGDLVRVISPSVAALFGISAQDFLTTPGLWRDAIVPPNISTLTEMRRELAGETARTYTYAIRCPNGRAGQVWGRYKTLFDPDGQPVRLDGILIDVTDHVREGAALVEREGYFRALTEHAADLIVVAEADRTIRYASPARLHILGAALNGAHPDLFAHLHPDDTPVAAELWAKVIATPNLTAVTEVRGRHSNGSWRVLEVTLTNLLQQPALRGIVLNIRDVTTRREAEERQESEAHQASFRAAIGTALTENADLAAMMQSCATAAVTHLEVTHVGIWILDEDTRMLELQAVAGRDVEDIEPFRSIPLGRYHVGRIAQDCQPFLTNDLTQDPDFGRSGRTRRAGLVAFAGYPLVVEGRTVGVMALFARRPLTQDALATLAVAAPMIANGIERARATEQLQEANRRLEDLLRQLQRSQQQVIQQERLRALGEMASGIAHDFNNCLAQIQGYLELLLDVRPDDLHDLEKVRASLTSVRLASDDAADVVRRLQEFYRVRRDDELFHPTDLNVVVDEAVDLTRPCWRNQALADGRTIQVVTQLAQLPPITANESELRTVLTNLIFNAVAAMPAGGVITIRTRAERAGVVLEVEDSGIGMSDEVRRRCLEPFFTTKGPQGSGLGLAMAYGVVQRHRGSIDVMSEPGRGTTFTLHLPIEADNQDRSSPADDLREQVSPRRILVVDDEPALRQILAAYLAADGHLVETAANGREGFQKFQAEGFDLVITDRAMPEMNGDCLARAIKSWQPRTTVVMLTGFGVVMEAEGEVIGCVDAVATKPIRADALRRMIAGLLQQRQGGESEPSLDSLPRDYSCKSRTGFNSVISPSKE